MQDPVQAVVRFFRALDDREYEALAAMLAPGGEWHRQGAVLRSRADVLAAMAKRSPTLRIHHLLTNLFAVPHGEAEAEVTGYMLVVRHDSGAPPAGPSPLPGIENIRTIHARMVRTEDGWRVRHLANDPASFAVGG